MALIAAPARQFKTWSMILLMATGVFDLAVVFAKTLGDMHVMTAEHFAIVNAALVFLTGAVKFIQQNIPLTTEQKTDLVAAAASQPVKKGEDDLTVHIQSVNPQDIKEL